MDFGGPRKEFFALVLQKIQEHYFDPVKEWSGDYEVIGKIMGLSMLQNGKLPRILTAELVTEVFQSEMPRQFVKDLRRGLDALGLFQVAKQLPTFVHFFTPQTVKLTYRMLHLLRKPNFSPAGSNQRTTENNVYGLFNNYLREVAAGRRQSISLQNILRFVTGAEEEPALGFTIQQSLYFVTSESFLPTANTCTNRLNLTVPSENLPLPSSKELFQLFDFAFSNTYFGYE